MRKLAILDVDGVMLNFLDPFLRWCGFTHLTVDDIDEYDFSYLFGSQSEFIKRIDDFTHTDIYANLPPLASTYDLQRLHDAGYEIRCLTQVHAEAVHDARISNLNSAFPEADHIHIDVQFTRRGESKTDIICKELRKYDEVVVIEDHPNTLRELGQQTEWMLNREGETNLTVIGIWYKYNQETIENTFFVQPALDFADAVDFILK